MLDVLNCYAGHLKFTFDPANKAELERAKKTVNDMLSRGYVILAELPDGTLRKVKAFDKKAVAYVIDEMAPNETSPKTKKPRKLPARSTKATAIGPTAGG